MEKVTSRQRQSDDDRLELVRNDLRRDDNGNKYYAALEDLSFGIDEGLADDVQRSVRKFMPSDRSYDSFYPPNVISYATSWRKATNDYPGKLVAASVIKYLFDHGIECYSDIMTPSGRSWDDYFLRVDSETKDERVMVILMTQAFFRSVPCLEEVSEALEHNFIILPVRVEATSVKGVDISRDRASMWPMAVINEYAHKVGWTGEAGTKQMNQLTLKRNRVTKEIAGVLSIPCHGTLLQDPSGVMNELVSRIKHKDTQNQQLVDHLSDEIKL